MLPAHHKLTSPAEFHRTIKKGSKAGSRTVVVHVFDRTATCPDAPVATTGPRFGLVVSKAVGNAVVRHRTSRRLRHVCMSLMDSPDVLPRGADVVVRALPRSGSATSEELRADIVKALRKAARRKRND